MTDEPVQVHTLPVVSRFDVCALPAGNPHWEDFLITVERVARGRWAVRHGGKALSDEGTWDVEGLPSGLSDEWLAGHRFGLDDALELAVVEAPKITANGTTVDQALETARQAKGQPEPPVLPGLRLMLHRRRPAPLRRQV